MSKKTVVPITQKSRYHNLVDTVSPADKLGIAIVPDPDAIASALTLKRLFRRKTKKIESSEINKKNISAFRQAFENLQLVEDTAFIHMGEVNDADTLVIVADFFMKMAEASWCLTSGIHGQKLIIIFRYTGFRLHAGQIASRLFGKFGSAGGHKSAARAEISLSTLKNKNILSADLKEYIVTTFKKH